MTDTFGQRLPDAFGYFDPESSCWKTSQQSFDFLMSSEKSSVTFTNSGSMRSGRLYGHPTLELRTVVSDGSAAPTDETPLLPSPSAQESTPTEEFIQEMVEAGVQPDERLYLPGRKWHSQRTLSRIAPSLLPTPRSATARTSRDAMVGTDHWAAPSLEQAVEIASGILPREFDSWDEVPGKSRLLPSPTSSDGKGSTSPDSAKEWDTRGQNLPEAVQKLRGEGILPTPGTGPLLEATAPLLPTPAAADGSGGKQHKVGTISRTGQKEDGTKVQVSLRDALNLLPTPAARDWKGGTTPTSVEATRRPRGDGGASDLPSVVKLMSTPTARDWKGEPGPAHEHGGLNREIKALLPTPVGEPTTGNGHARNLGAEAKLMATPRATDSNGIGRHGTGGMDLRTQVSEIGDRTEQPSTDGREQQESEHPTLWTPEDG